MILCTTNESLNHYSACWWRDIDCTVSVTAPVVVGVRSERHRHAFLVDHTVETATSNEIHIPRLQQVEVGLDVVIVSQLLKLKQRRGRHAFAE